MPNRIELKGFKEFQDKLNRLPSKLKKEVGAVVKVAANEWEARAKLSAPVDQGLLKNGITNKMTGETSAEVFSNVEYSPYIEWGTKSKARIPADIAAYAAQFKGGKKGGDPKKFIYAWMNRVGIPKDRQWFVFISIMTKGINPHPFFFIQKPIVEKQFLNDLDQVLKEIGD